jgi:methylenetetrahydrofolate dehydrogenase (NAD+)
VREYTQRNSLKLVGILANQGPHRHDSELYSERIQDTFIEDGIDYELWRCPSGGGDPSADGIRRIQDQIRRANQRDDIHGVLIFYPIYPHGPKGPYKNRITGVYYKTHDDHLRDLVDPTKDVEGLGGTKWFNIRDRHPFQQLPLVYPCTALSVVQIIEKHHILKGSATSSWQDQTIAIVNRSEIMGRPLAAMLAQKGATVYSIDIDSILQFRPNGRLHLCSRTATSLESCLQESQVVVTGVPSTGFRLPIPSIAESTTLINVSEFPNVCELTLVTERPDVQYIPQVGKVTVAVLENNLMNLRIAVASSEAQ